MVDDEVESILREIRERVRGGQNQPLTVSIATTETDASESFVMSNGDRVPESAAALARMGAHLSTMTRAWDRLPPLVSNRSGDVARLELWVKRQLKRAMRWFTWEQVNFNAANLHALRDTLEAFAAYEQQLGRLHAQLGAEIQTRRQEFEQNQAKIEAQRADIEAQCAEIQARQADIEAQCVELRRQHAVMMEAQSIQVNAQLSGLAEELRESDQRMLDEQRVCFKQLSLETSETWVQQDRARRDIELRLDRLENRGAQARKRKAKS
jgi:hypothetical protein